MPPASARAADPRVFSYVLDADDRIVAVNVAWAAFAAENGAPDLSRSVLGRPLWPYVADATTRHLYGLLFRRVRWSGLALHVRFRCDTPTLVREMDLEIAPALDGHGDRALVLRGQVLTHRVRAPVALLDPRVPRRTDALVRMCAWCKRVDHDGRWLEVEDALAANHWFCHAPVPAVTHGICAPCARAVHTLLDGEDAAIDGAPP